MVGSAFTVSINIRTPDGPPRRLLRIVHRKSCSARLRRSQKFDSVHHDATPDRAGLGDRGATKVVSNQRFYYRRAAEERMRAARALTPAARAWHQGLANDFAQRAVEGDPQIRIGVSA